MHSNRLLQIIRWFPLLTLMVVLPATTHAADDSKPAAIEKLGGKIRRVGQELEIEFHLCGRQLTDDGLKPVASLKNIVSLNLRDTRITNAGLKHLSGLSTLRRLHLERTRVGDSGIAHLSGLTNLEYLNLYGTKITDAGLRHLTRLKKLKRLYVWQTRVTDAGIKRLKKALPGLKIIRGVDLTELPKKFPPPEPAPKKPKLQLKWVAVANRDDAPQRSKSGDNTQVYFENRSKETVKVFWIGYNGKLKLYGEIAPAKTRQQNTYSNNAWLITDKNDTPLGYFVVSTLKDSLAVIPGNDAP